MTREPSLDAWLVDVVGGRRVLRRRRCRGGITSDVHEVTIVKRSAHPVRVIVKSYPRAKDASPARWIRREIETLEAIAPTAIRSPEVIASDPDGTHTGGIPALVMTRVPGRIDLSPTDGDAWLRQMARCLVEIQSLRVRVRDFERWTDWSGWRAPDGVPDPAVWTRAIELLRGEPAPYQPVLVHRDYQHFNILWTHGRLTGVIDWGSACFGPPDVDVGHCRLNLAILHSATWAERFRLMYEAEAGRKVDPYWDLNELLVFGNDWPRFIPKQVAGRAPLDVAGMPQRVEELIATVLARS